MKLLLAVLVVFAMACGAVEDEQDVEQGEAALCSPPGSTSYWTGYPFNGGIVYTINYGGAGSSQGVASPGSYTWSNIGTLQLPVIQTGFADVELNACRNVGIQDSGGFFYSGTLIAPAGSSCAGVCTGFFIGDAPATITESYVAVSPPYVGCSTYGANINLNSQVISGLFYGTNSCCPPPWNAPYAGPFAATMKMSFANSKYAYGHGGTPCWPF